MKINCNGDIYELSEDITQIFKEQGIDESTKFLKAVEFFDGLHIKTEDGRCGCIPKGHFELIHQS